MRTSIAVGQENKLLEVQHPHAAKDGGEDRSEEIADLKKPHLRPQRDESRLKALGAE
jgi:hypothetical protein